MLQSLRRAWVLWLLTAIAVAVAVVMPLLSWRIWYGGPATWPGLIGSYTATLAAFVFALWWDRHRAILAGEVAVDKEQDERRIELRRRLEGVLKELDRLSVSVKDTVEKGGEAKYFLSDLPTAAWSASSERLAALMANYRLVVDLGILYAQVDDLRWRLRLLSELWSQNTTEAELFRGLVVTFAGEVKRNLDVLEPKLKAQLGNPEVQRLGLVYTESGTVVGRAAISATSRITGTPHETEGAIQSTSTVGGASTPDE